MQVFDKRENGKHIKIRAPIKPLQNTQIGWWRDPFNQSPMTMKKMTIQPDDHEEDDYSTCVEKI